ncbi:hypothetical protein [Singulisphaera sp. PoT]|uniref:hypothetical protein n=1 Tax=Singulisphaera sp. PoT TaxID=3411797 RepID=UPI003BF5C317
MEHAPSRPRQEPSAAVDPAVEARTRKKARAFPAGFLGMLALVLLVESGISRHGLDISRPEAWEWWLSGKAARKQVVGRPILCFGSSMVKQAVIPRIIGQKLGCPVYNLSLCAGPAPSSYHLLRRALDSGSQPRAILVEFHPAGLTDPPSLYVDYWPHLLEFRELADLALTAKDPGFFATAAVARLLPSFRDRKPIRTNLAAAFRGESESNRRYNAPMRRNILANRGAKVIPRNPEYRGEIAEHLSRTLLSDTWDCNPVNVAYVERFLSLAQAHDIPVFWLMPPFIPALQAGREAKGLDARYREFARHLQARYPNLTVLDGLKSNYVDPAFNDGMHFNAQGAYAFSHDLADALGARLGSPSDGRWVAMPDYREHNPEVQIEDFARSVAVTNDADSRRR